MKVSEGTISGALIVLETGDILERMNINDTVIFAIEAGSITGCTLVNSVIHLSSESIGHYDPDKAAPIPSARRLSLPENGEV